MASRPLTDTAVLKQLDTVNRQVKGRASGKERLELLRRQADLGDQRDAAIDNARRARNEGTWSRTGSPS